MAKKIPQKKNFAAMIIKRLMNNVNINEIFRGLNHNYYVTGYEHNQKIKPLYIKLPKYVCTGKTFKKI